MRLESLVLHVFARIGSTQLRVQSSSAVIVASDEGDVRPPRKWKCSRESGRERRSMSWAFHFRQPALNGTFPWTSDGVHGRKSSEEWTYTETYWPLANSVSLVTFYFNHNFLKGVFPTRRKCLDGKAMRAETYTAGMYLNLTDQPFADSVRWETLHYGQLF